MGGHTECTPKKIDRNYRNSGEICEIGISVFCAIGALHCAILTVMNHDVVLCSLLSIIIFFQNLNFPGILRMKRQSGKFGPAKSWGRAGLGPISGAASLCQKCQFCLLHWCLFSACNYNICVYNIQGIAVIRALLRSDIFL